MTTPPLDRPTPADTPDGHELSPAKFEPGRFALRDTWFPIEHAANVARAPSLRRIHAQPYWLWRDGSRPRAAAAHPAQIQGRHARLGMFTDDGGDYPAIERYGFLWVWYGDPMNASPELIPDIPYLPRVGRRPRASWGTYRFHCTYELACENLLDLTHVDFVHRGFLGGSQFENDQISVESTSETITTIRETRKWRVPTLQRWVIGAQLQDVRWVVHIHLRSGVSVLHANFVPGPSVRLVQNMVADSPGLTRMLYSFNPARGTVLSRTLPLLIATGVARQDDVVLRAQNPRYLRPSERVDANSRFDTASVRYRARMQQLIQRQRAGDFSYRADGDPGADVSGLLQVDRCDGP